MILNVVAIRDSKSGIFSRPFFVPHLGVGRRMFGDLAVDVNTDVGKHPEDYALFHLGDYDDNSGALVSNSQPDFIVNAVEFVKS